MIACATCDGTGFLAVDAAERATVEIACHVCHGAGQTEPPPMPEHCLIHAAGALCEACGHLITAWAVCPYTGEAQHVSVEDRLNTQLLEALWRV